MKAPRKLLVLLSILLLMVARQPANAQCAQCSSQVSTNRANGGTQANGLNKGIVYLLVAPYLAVAIVGYVWYKKYRRKNVLIDIKTQKLHLN
jgi:hypothetical protein